MHEKFIKFYLIQQIHYLNKDLIAGFELILCFFSEIKIRES